MYETHQFEGFLPEVQCCGRCSRPLTQHPFLVNELNDPYFYSCERFPDLTSETVYFADDDLVYNDAEVDPDTDEEWSTEFIPGFDYIALVDFEGNPRQSLVFDAPDYSYNPADIFTDDVAHEREFNGLHDHYQKELRSLDSLERWSDNEPEFCTIAIDRWRDRNHKFPYAEPKTSVTLPSGTLYFPGSKVPLATERIQQVLTTDEQVHGFTSRVLESYIITERYQNKFLNIFKGRDGNLHIGMLTIEYDQHSMPIATCKHGDCRGRVFSFRSHFAIPPTRQAMEDFILTLIRHGNNHGPDWYTGRSDFTYIHAVNCDTTEHQITYRTAMIESYGQEFEAMLPVVTPCNSHKPTIFAAMIDPKNLTQTYKFLKQHMRFCRSTNCKCNHYESLLWDRLYGATLVPDSKEFNNAS